MHDCMQANKVIKYVHLPWQFDISQLQQEVQQIAEQFWKKHYQSRHFEGDWSAISLRSINGEVDNIFVSPNEDAVYADTIFLKDSPYLQNVLAFFQCTLKAVRLMKLGPGSFIKPHRDNDLSFEHGEFRCHIPVFTNNQVDFYLQDERIELKTGECWYMNFNLEHHLANRSSHDRIHLVIDGMVNDWIKVEFNQPGVLKKEIELSPYDEETKKQIIASLRLMNTETSQKIADELESSIVPASNEPDESYDR